MYGVGADEATDAKLTRTSNCATKSFNINMGSAYPAKISPGSKTLKLTCEIIILTTGMCIAPNRSENQGTDGSGEFDLR